MLIIYVLFVTIIYTKIAFYMHLTTSEKAITLNIDPRPVFNSLVYTSNLLSSDNGTYRIYAALRDPDGNVLEYDDTTKIETNYEFDITVS